MQENREYRAICFDLDGTLLPMDIDEFMAAYFRRIAEFVGGRGLPPDLFMQALREGTREMAEHDDGATNEAAFWRRFANVYGADAQAAPDGWTSQLEARVRGIATDFYEEAFPRIGDEVRPNPAATRAVRTLAAKGYPLVLATMPMFPRRAVEHRLAWAGVDAAAFARITSYENSTAVKPRAAYYSENLAALGVRGEDVLMVGNNTLEDLAFMKLGADAWLVTDFLLNPIDFDVTSVKHGSLEDFANWAAALPECSAPATFAPAVPAPVATQTAPAAPTAGA